MERMTKGREAEIRGNLEIGAAPGPDAVWRSACRDLLAEVDALRAEVDRLRAAPGAVVRVASDGTVEVHGPALVDLAEALLPRVRPTEPVEVDEDVVGDLPRGPVMP